MRRLPPLAEADLSSLAMDWRGGFFQAITASFERGEDSPDIDKVHAQVLDKLLAKKGISLDVWTAEHREILVQAWHRQLGRPKH